MNILIVEDDRHAYERLKELLMETDSSIQVAGHTGSIGQTVHWLNNNPEPELIFMDIHLSDGLAFHIFTVIDIEIPVVFTAEHEKYAMEAFKVNSIDYLIKPVSRQDVERALKKYRTLVHSGSQAGKYPDKILIPANDKLIPVNVSDISYFYGSNGNMRTVLKNNKTFHYVKTLEAIQESLDPSLFFRANKQYIIAKKSITNLTVWFDNRIMVSLDTEIPERVFISKNRAALFKKWLTGVDKAFNDSL